VILFSKSFLLGFLVAIPVGPVAGLILRRSLRIGSLAGLISGVGAAAADSLFALLASLGLAVLLEEIGDSRHYIGGIGGFVLVFVGLRLFFQRPPNLDTAELLTERYLSHYLWDALSIFLVTLINPMTIIAFAALFAGSSLIPLDPRRIDYL
jgi:threonine/homoserine/homoserine lactone efflux protein